VRVLTRNSTNDASRSSSAERRAISRGIAAVFARAGVPPSASEAVVVVSASRRSHRRHADTQVTAVASAETARTRAAEPVGGVCPVTGTANQTPGSAAVSTGRISRHRSPENASAVGMDILMLHDASLTAGRRGRREKRAQTGL